MPSFVTGELVSSAIGFFLLVGIVVVGISATSKKKSDGTTNTNNEKRNENGK